MEVYLGIDLGTTGVKTVVFDKEFRILGQAYVTLKLITLSDTEIEQDANEWWAAVVTSVRSAIIAAGVTGGAVKALSVSSQGISVVPVDKDIKPLGNAISWLDNRSVSQKQQILEKLDMQTVFNITGKRASEVYTLPKLMWIKQHKPEIYNAAWKFLMPHDFILAKLTSKAITDRSMAAGTMLYDIQNLCWSEKLAKIGHIDIQKLPDVVCAGTPAGKLTAAAADELGLSSDTLAVVGGQDQKCAALGAGIDDSTATVSLGTAGAVIRRVSTPVADPDIRIPVFPDVTEGRWILEGVAITACESLEWLKKTLFKDKDFRELDALAESAGYKKNGVMFFPYLAGSTMPVWDMTARGGFLGLNLSSTEGDIIRSVLEGVAFQLKAILDAMSSLSGEPERINVFGGGAKSPLWCRILSNIFGVDVNTLETSEAAATGAAMLAGLGCGAVMNENIQSYVKIKNTYYPDSELSKAYKSKYASYSAAAEKLLK